LIKGWEVSETIDEPKHTAIALDWFEEKLFATRKQIDEQYANYKISEVLMTTYKLIWDDFCSWLLEIVKPDFGQPINIDSYERIKGIFEDLLKLIHPFMPFITEEIWHLIKERNDCIIVAPWPSQACINNGFINQFETIQEAITAIRNIRKEKNISPKEPLSLYIRKSNEAWDSRFDSIIIRLGNLNELKEVNDKVDNAASFLLKTYEFFIPIGDKIDKEAEKERLTKDLEYTKGFLESVMKKLSNEKFVSNAKPEVIGIERKKQQDAETKIRVIEEQIKNLS
jgi:valyl-tRNA synthetase